MVDSCNGAGSVVAPRLLEALGAEVFTVNVTPDGMFPRGAEPVPENLGALCAAVKEHGADVGFAQDMDADRLAVVSERGEPIGEEYTLVLAARYVLARERGPVVANLATTHALDGRREFAAPSNAPASRGQRDEECGAWARTRRRWQGASSPAHQLAPQPRRLALGLHLLADPGRESRTRRRHPPHFMLKETRLPFRPHRRC